MVMIRCLVLLLAAACVAGPAVSPMAERTSVRVAAVNARDYGALCDGVTDDRAALQAALNAGGDVLIPNGTCLVSKGAGFWCLTVPAGVHLHGESRDGAVLVQASVGASVRLLEVDTANVTIDTLTLDGAKATQANNDEHRAGIFANHATGLTIRNVTSRDFTGDGVYIYTGSNAVTIDNVLLTGNIRNGITFGGGTVGGTVTNSTFAGNGAQQFDSEPGNGTSVDGLTIQRNTFDPGLSTQYVLTVAGSSTKRSTGWLIEDNTFLGTPEIIEANDITFRRNTIRHAANGAALLIYHGNDRILIAENDIALTGPLGPEAIAVIGTGVNQASDHVSITRNVISAGKANAYGVHIVTARSVEITDNVILGSGISDPYKSGVYARATQPGEDIRAIVVRRNRISSFGAAAVMTAAAPGVVRLVDVSDNILDDPTGAMKGLALNGNDLRQSGNLMLGNVTVLIAGVPSGTWQAWGNGDRWTTP